MLVAIEPTDKRYVVAVNNATSATELVADLSYLELAAPGTLVFDFTHMAAPLTQELRDDFLPASFGYQPTRNLVDLVSTLAEVAPTWRARGYDLVAVLPRERSRVGQFLAEMELGQLLSNLAIELEAADPAEAELGRDDVRENLIPLTAIQLMPNGGPDFAIVHAIHNRVERVFAKALGDASELALSFTSIVYEALDNMIEYGRGGIVGGLYYPRVGEVEITLGNRIGGFGGSNPAEQLALLLERCEGATSRLRGGGNGISELSRLAMCCFGTLLLRNGNAHLYMLPDSSVITTIEDTGMRTRGASVSLLLQLLPDQSVLRTDPMRSFEQVLKTSLAEFRCGIGPSV
jgi:hypothetical protein